MFFFLYISISFSPSSNLHGTLFQCFSSSIFPFLSHNPSIPISYLFFIYPCSDLLILFSFILVFILFQSTHCSCIHTFFIPSFLPLSFLPFLFLSILPPFLSFISCFVSSNLIHYPNFLHYILNVHLHLQFLLRF